MTKKAEQLKEEIICTLKSGGAPYAGIADLTKAENGMNLHVEPRLKRFERAVSFIIPFPRSVIEELLEGPTHTYLHYYRAVNTLIDDLSIRLCALIEAHGFEAFPVPSSQRTGKHRLDSIFPHRIAAFLAGMGWIGKSGCLVNPTFGPRVRLGTVLTTAPLVPDEPLEVRCGECTRCAEACPAQAIKGRLFAPDIPLTERLAPERCDSYQNEVRDRFGKRVCGLCLAACPYGKPHSAAGNGQ
ncbi:4Fe-4S double cluster binding domain-containing protein [Dethiobacter alkaliphilus]|uniref:4Fe-4S ferredoxin iron-sulfur binding domain protein n=1 Tax=Dethiobacter alkaliphilus AHT 1 TaxID=555088 RepID=C0GJP0_DETAL|nr:4Fe-4S double cluster binding domain-containing protein [Dethiobacter alkaliphilus]EEG76462.1 4Fe-4S ferredoxin iron-sulfur binding domain protein [Dethiobacter alkaliphilus AHT 1]